MITEKRFMELVEEFCRRESQMRVLRQKADQIPTGTDYEGFPVFLTFADAVSNQSLIERSEVARAEATRVAKMLATEGAPLNVRIKVDEGTYAEVRVDPDPWVQLEDLPPQANGREHS